METTRRRIVAILLAATVSFPSATGAEELRS